VCGGVRAGGGASSASWKTKPAGGGVERIATSGAAMAWFEVPRSPRDLNSGTCMKSGLEESLPGELSGLQMACRCVESGVNILSRSSACNWNEPRRGFANSNQALSSNPEHLKSGTDRLHFDRRWRVWWWHAR
jgi:hypothetical protein